MTLRSSAVLLALALLAFVGGRLVPTDRSPRTESATMRSESDAGIAAPELAEATVDRARSPAGAAATRPDDAAPKSYAGEDHYWLMVFVQDRDGLPVDLEDLKDSVLCVDPRGRARRPATDYVDRHFNKRSGRLGVEASSRGDGRFWFRISHAQVPERLVFVSPASGTGVLDVLPEWIVDGPPSEVVVTLRGDGRIHGRVVDPVGNPVAGLVLRVEWESDAESEAERDAETLEHALQGRPGRLESDTTTAEDGSFAFDGLAARRFVVSALRFGLSDYEREWIEVDRVVAAADAPDRTYEIARPCVEVRVRNDGWFGRVDEQDEEPASSDDEAVILEEEESPDDWQEHDDRELRIDVYDAGPLDGPIQIQPKDTTWDVPAADPIRSTRIRLSWEDPMRRFALPHGRRYLVTGSIGTSRLRSVVVAVPEAHSIGRATLDAERVLPTGTLLVELDVAEVAPDEGDPLGAVWAALWVEDAETGEPMFQRKQSWSVDRSELVPQDGFRFPPGRYRVGAIGIPALALHHGTVASRRRLGRAEVIVEVIEDETATARLRLDDGGRLCVEVRGAWTDADERALDGVDVEAAIGFWEREDGRARRTGALITLDAEHVRLSTPLTRIGPAMLHGSAGGDHVVDWWPLGETHVSEVVPAGTYTLRATHATRPPIIRSVTIAPGETATVTLDFGG
ncbi:MAG: hypothetical protein AAGB93_18840 [Planctomycetota bacterium]